MVCCSRNRLGVQRHGSRRLHKIPVISAAGTTEALAHPNHLRTYVLLHSWLCLKYLALSTGNSYIHAYMHTWLPQRPVVVVVAVDAAGVAAAGSGGFEAGGRPAAASVDGNTLGLKTS